jgi:Membrane domain of glycerophosphoryl diester phosphodiesterase
VIDRMVTMSTDAGGSPNAGPPPPGYPPPGYPPPGYQGDPPPAYQGYPQSPGFPPPGYPPPGYPPPGYPPPPGYGGPQPGYGPQGGYPPPGYPQPGYAPHGYPPGYGPPGYGPPPVAQAIKPGVIPLRPLSLSDIFNGAVAYIRANPKATLGLTTIVVVATQLLALILSVGPLAVTGDLRPTLTGEEVPTGVLLGSSVSSLAGYGATWLSGILLTGMLTVVVGRAVFGAGITIGEAWQRLRPRLWALIGFALLEGIGAALIVGVGFGIAVGIGFAVNGVAGLLVGIPLGLAVIALLVYLGTMLAFTPSIIVLERLEIFPAISRSFKLVRNDFWRVFGIWLLGQIVAGLIAGAVSVPFSFGGQILLMSASSTVAALIALVLLSVGSAIGQIITAPFSAGVVVLLYTDRRIRAEALDLVLQTGAAFGPGAPADSTDHLWLTRQS